MHITRIYVDGFRRLQNFSMALNNDLTILIGDNETGKSTVLEAIHLALTRQHAGASIDYTLDPYLFNSKYVETFFQTLRAGNNWPPPRIIIEAYFSDNGTAALARLKGTNNTRSEDSPGVCMLVEVDGDHAEALKEYACDESNPQILPVEFYRCHWRSFANNGITLRNLPLRTKAIDTSLPRINRGPSRYVSQLVGDALTDSQRRDLSIAYRKMRHGFSQEAGVRAINDHLESHGDKSNAKRLSVQLDLSSRTKWDSAISAHLDDLPLDCAGKGEQCRVQVRLAIADSVGSRVLLIEEPENHLSHSNLNVLMHDICSDCEDRQVVITTHSAYVLNKLGVDKLRLLSANADPSVMSQLSDGTRDYFMKLPGFDTLRLILARRCILVEGPSDELIVTKSYVNKHGRMPLEDGVDVISVSSLAFKRFLEIAKLLHLNVSVVTDNDGDVESLKTKYQEYMGSASNNIRICYDEDESCRTLEPQIIKANSVQLISKIVGKSCTTQEELVGYMQKNKTDIALKLFNSTAPWTTPGYIADAILD